MSVTAIIQARMGSSRLPGKVLRRLAGKPMLQRVLESVASASRVENIVVAIPDNPADSKIEAFCRSQGWNFFRGHETDVLDRYYRTAAAYCASTIVRVTSDCPLIDPRVIDHVIEAYERARSFRTYASNINPVRTYPRGMDTEVFGFDALEAAWRSDNNPGWREHVTPYMYRMPEKFKIVNVTQSDDRSDLRLTVDTEADFELINWILGQLGDGPHPWQNIARLIDANPEMRQLNRQVQQKVVS